MQTKRILSIILSVMLILGCCLCPISAAEIQEGIIHNIAQKYSGENLVNDSNMMWFVSDMTVYEQVYHKSMITPVIKQDCLDKIIAEADAATTPSALAKSIIALRALGYDAKNVNTANLTKIDVVNKLTTLVDSKDASVTNEYTLPYVILALQQGTDYATNQQMDYLISTALETKAAWQSTTWGTDAATPMLLSLAPYYNSNALVKAAVDETIPIITAFQDETGLISNAASHGLAMAAFSALGIDSTSITNNGKDLFDGLMSVATENNDGFEPSYNSFSTEQGFRGLLSTLLTDGTRIYDFADNPYNEAHASLAEYAPVTFDVTPADAVVNIEGVSQVDSFKYHLPAGTYNYSVSHAVYQSNSGIVIISPEEAQNHIPKTVSVTLSPKQHFGGSDNNINVKVKVMVHNESECQNSFTYRHNSDLYKPLVSKTVTIKKGQSVLKALTTALNSNNTAYVENNGYISSINNIKEFDHGSNSGWMFTVDGAFSDKGSDQTYLSNNQTIVWFYTDDYTLERTSQSYSPSSTGSSNKSEQQWGLENKNPDIKKREITDKSKTFADVKGHKNQSAIEALAQRGIISGKDNIKFEPDGLMTRAEFATIIVNGLCLPIKDGKIFTDISSDEWFFDYVNTAYAYGIIKGVSDKEFNPDGLITKEEAAVMAFRAASLCGLDTKITNYRNILSGFSDYTTSSKWATDALAFCYKNNLWEDDLKIQPSIKVCRGEIAQLIYSMLVISKLI
ncbi:MAG: S-layer homology domain-containing protein [Clostridia bacterium]|nr:S-layer homology domain-containing protein [Clostridia bacterium]